MGQDFKLYASPETKAAIPPEQYKLLEQLLPQWSGRNVVLVSKKDTKPGAPTDGSATPEQQYTGNFLTFIHGLPMAKQKAPDGAENLVLQDAYTRAAKGTGEFAASDMPTLKSTGLMTVSVDYEHLNQIIPAGLSGIPAKFMHDIPGTSTDWMLATVAHECGHLASEESDTKARKAREGKYSNSDSKLVDTTTREIIADRKGLTNYFGLRAKMPDINPNVPKTFMELRAIGTIRQSGDALTSLQPDPTDHGTNPAITIDGTKVSAAKGIRPAAIDAALIDVNTRVHLLLGLEYGDKLSAADKQKAADRTNTILGLLTDPAVKAEIEKQGKTVDQAFASGIGKNRTQLLEKIAADPKGKAAMTTLLEGSGIAHEDPLKEYAAIKFLYQKGEFKTEHQQKIVEEYMSGLENHLNVTDEGVDKVKNYMADMERDWVKLQQQEKQTPYIQNVVDVTKAQLHEPNAIREATGPATTAAV